MKEAVSTKGPNEAFGKKKCKSSHWRPVMGLRRSGNKSTLTNSVLQLEPKGKLSQEGLV